MNDVMFGKILIQWTRKGMKLERNDKNDVEKDDTPFQEKRQNWTEEIEFIYIYI